MVLLSMGVKKVRNGYNERFYVAYLVWNGMERYSLKRFHRADKADRYGRRLQHRFYRIYMDAAFEEAQNVYQPTIS